MEIDFLPQVLYSSFTGPVAHLVEHLICTEGVGGSNPLGSTREELICSDNSKPLKVEPN